MPATSTTAGTTGMTRPIEPARSHIMVGLAPRREPALVRPSKGQREWIDIQCIQGSAVEFLDSLPCCRSNSVDRPARTHFIANETVERAWP